MNQAEQCFKSVAGSCWLLFNRGIRATPFLLVGVLALAVSACDSAPSPPNIPDISLPAISSDNPTPKPGPGALAPTASGPGPTAAPDPAPVAPGPTVGGPTAGSIPVPRLVIAEVPADIPEYSRKDWKHWNDTDKDCQDTRAEVLIAESRANPTFATDKSCRVTGGSWNGLYTGKAFTEAGDLDIDHLVPLKNAHLSGGWQWNEERKEDYANSMAADYHLIAVEKYANRAKGARGPEEWQPPDATYHCEYAYSWIAVKAGWGLTATAAEWAALQEMLARCPQPLEVIEEGSAGTLPSDLARLREELGLAKEDGGGSAVLVATQHPESASTSVVPPERFSGSLVISEIMPDPSAVRDSAGEWFEIYNPNAEQAVNLLGWTIRKEEEDGHRISAELLVPPGGYAALARNGDEATNGGIAAAYEYRGFNLTNDGDVIELVGPDGRVVDRVEYGETLVFPGASTTLAPGFLDADANDDEANWCHATTAMPNGDFGTPGQGNDACKN